MTEPVTSVRTRDTLDLGGSTADANGGAKEGACSSKDTLKQAARDAGKSVAQIHIRHIWPLPMNLGELLKSYDRILVPEMNTGQLKTVLRDQYLVDARPLNKVSGQPFRIAEIEAAIDEQLRG